LSFLFGASAAEARVNIGLGETVRAEA